MTTMNSVYKINKGINKPIEFKGLKAQYIGYLGAGIVLLLVIFAILYIAGIDTISCVVVIAILGVTLFMVVYRLNDTYGQHGLLKKIARHSIPDYLIVRSRTIFYRELLQSPVAKS
jgi:hypothetical protein